MFSKRDLGIMVTTIIVITVAVMIGRSLRANNEETLTTVEIITEAHEIVTERVTEPVTERHTEVTTASKTEAVTEEPKTERDIERERQIIETISEDAIAMEVEAETQSALGEYDGVELKYSEVYYITDNHLTRSNGSIRFNGHRETWYSTNESCGVVTARELPGKHVADDGTIRDKDGYVCVASSDLAFYTKVMTSVGPGKVYDCGCSHGTIDVYTTW